MKANKRSIFSRRDTPHQRPEIRLDPVSLMHPDTRPQSFITTQTTSSVNQWIHDLGLDDFIRELAPDRRYRSFIRGALAALNTDPAVIEWRQAVLADFLHNPKLVEDVAELLPQLAGLSENNTLLGRRQRSPLMETTDRLAELEIYTQVIQGLNTALSRSEIKSQALQHLHKNIAVVTEDDDFLILCQQLPQLRKPLERITSLTIGINLDAQLRPISAVLMRIHSNRLQGPASFLERVIGPSDDDEETGITPLNYLPRDAETRPFNPLFQDLEKLMSHVAKPVAQELDQYTRVSSDPIKHLEFELAFYVAAARLIHRLQQAGVHFCRPEIAPKADRVAMIDALTNISLVLRLKDQTIASDVTFNQEEKIAILTGPNSGGKTTYLQSTGLAIAMFQAGLFIPAQQACISPVDALLTHFPALETHQQGRLAEEAHRLREVFQHITPYSFVLLNETFSSTSSGEALYLAQDILGSLRLIGTRAIFATHLIELVDHIAEIEANTPGDARLFSLVAGVEMDEDGEALRTFRIRRGMPLGRSYAKQIAQRHGISKEQILDAYHRRSNGHGEIPQLETNESA